MCRMRFGVLAEFAVLPTQRLHILIAVDSSERSEAALERGPELGAAWRTCTVMHALGLDASGHGCAGDP